MSEQKPSSDKPNSDHAPSSSSSSSIPDEDEVDDAVAHKEAREEAEKLNAVPYQRHENEERADAENRKNSSS